MTAQSIAPDPQNPDSYKGVAIDEPSDHVYDGTEHKWAPEVTDKDGNKLVEGCDYTVTYDTDDFVNVKVVNVTIAGMGESVRDHEGSADRECRQRFQGL